MKPQNCRDVLRLVLCINILVFIIALIRFPNFWSDGATQSTNLVHIGSHKQVDPKECECQEEERELLHLKSKFANLSSTLFQRDRDIAVMSEKLSKKDSTSVLISSDHITQQSNSPHYKPVKLGDDIQNGQEFQVPNLVHYIWYNTEQAPFQFLHMLSVLSAHKFLKPDKIYFHTNMEPVGKYWERVRTLPEFTIMKRDTPNVVFGEQIKPPKFNTSHSNVDRVLVLQEYGGIYMDFDFIVIRSFDELRKHVCTIGLESDTKSCGSVIVCSKDAFFLTLWINSYIDDYRIDEWAYNTGIVPFNLAKRFPHLVNAERTRLNRPNFKELGEIWSPTRKWWRWQDNFGFHTWYRLWKDNYGGQLLFNGMEPDDEYVKKMDCAFGEIARLILFNTTELM